MSKIVERTLDFIELFAREQRALTLSEISRLLSIPPSSCHDVLATLSRRGFIYEPTTGKGYYPTYRLKHLTDKISAVDMFLEHADGPLRRLRDITGESVALSRVGSEGIPNILVYPGIYDFGINPVTGDFVRSYYATAAGHVYLGSLSEDERRKYFASTELVKLTPKTEIDVSTIEAKILEEKERGWALNVEGSVEGSAAISAGFHAGGSMYIITIPGPMSRILSKVDLMSQELVATCKVLSDD